MVTVVKAGHTLQTLSDCGAGQTFQDACIFHTHTALDLPGTHIPHGPHTRGQSLYSAAGAGGPVDRRGAPAATVILQLPGCLQVGGNGWLAGWFTTHVHAACELQLAVQEFGSAWVAPHSLT